MSLESNSRIHKGQKRLSRKDYNQNQSFLKQTRKGIDIISEMPGEVVSTDDAGTSINLDLIYPKLWKTTTEPDESGAIVTIDAQRAYASDGTATGATMRFVVLTEA